MSRLARLLALLMVLMGAALPAQAQLHEWKQRLSGHGAVAPAPPVNTDPLGVQLNGLSAVYHLKETNGPRISTVNVAAYSLPAGASYSSGTLKTDISGSSTLIAGINNALKGGFFFAGTGSHTITDLALTSNSAAVGGGLMFATAQTSGGSLTGHPVVDLEFCSIDSTGATSGTVGGAPTTEFQTGGSGGFTMGFCTIMNAPRDPWVNDSLAGPLHFHDNYWGAPAQRTTSTDHNEVNHINSAGSPCLIETSYYNVLDGTLPTTNAGNWQIQTGQGFDPTSYTGGPIACTFRKNVVHWGAATNQVTWSLKAVYADIDIFADTNVLDVGALGYFTCVTQADLTLTGVVGTFQSGETITAPGGKSAPVLGTLTSGANLHLSGWGTGAQITTGDAVTGSISGATATVSAAAFHQCNFHDMGSNRAFDGAPLSIH